MGRAGANDACMAVRVQQAIANMRALLHFDRLYIGGGNSRKLRAEELPKYVVLVDNKAGIAGGGLLWANRGG